MAVIFKKLFLWEDTIPHAPALNMARDEAMLRNTDTPILRFYQWDTPCQSIGYFTKWEESWRNTSIVRRWTGGGIVEHGEDITFSLVVPRANSFARLQAKETYQKIHQALSQALKKVGIEETLFCSQEQAESSQHCFEHPVPFDLLKENKKIAGGAQRRSRYGMLHQGSIQIKKMRPKFPEFFAEALGLYEKLPQKDKVKIEMAGKKICAQRYAQDIWLKRF